MKKTYKGSCHCGAVNFEADIDLSSGTYKGNCSICTKTRNWNVIIKPEDFRLTTGEGELKDYQFGPRIGHYLFGQTCGVRTFFRGYVEQIGGDYVAVQISSLNNVDSQEIVSAPISYTDCYNNDWGKQPTEIRHL
jgi:hypothetical protein